MRCTGWAVTAVTVGLVACGSGGGGNVTEPPANTPPTANFGVTCEQLTCTFSDSSTDAEGSIKAWLWAFGDGNSDTTRNPVHAYAAAQSYSATLTVTDSGGATNSVTKPVNVQAPTADLTCTTARGAGGAATCSFTLPQGAAIRAVSTDTAPCQAHGDVFAFTAPVVDTLTADGCFAPPGTQVQLPASPAGTQVSFDIRSGLPQYMTAVQVSGAYPEWTIAVEDAVGAPFPPDFADMTVTLTALPTGT
jgi:PKD repeat protein